jgi:hypothetical protein
MLDYIRVLIKRKHNFDDEERNLLSVAFKNAVGPLRTAYRIIDTLDKKERAKPDSPEKDIHTKHN